MKDSHSNWNATWAIVFITAVVTLIAFSLLVRMSPREAERTQEVLSTLITYGCEEEAVTTTNTLIWGRRTLIVWRCPVQTGGHTIILTEQLGVRIKVWRELRDTI